MSQFHLNSCIAPWNDHVRKGTLVGNSQSIIAPPYLQKSYTNDTLGCETKVGIDIIYEQDLQRSKQKTH